MPRTDDGDLFNGHSSLWHPWNDKTGIRHVPTYYTRQERAIFSPYASERMFEASTMEEMIEAVSMRSLYCFCMDTLNEHEFSYAHPMLGDERATPYLSRQGNIAALRLATKRKSGFLIPAPTWKYDLQPDGDFVERMIYIYQRFGYESTTPASLSEKVLRATLPTPIGINRPSVWLRRDILENSPGGRIDEAVPGFFRRVKTFDKRKAYCALSRCVPTPFFAPTIRYQPCTNEALDYAAGFWKCHIVARSRTVSPIQIDGRSPLDGESFTRWLWSGEISDCLDSSYDITIERGYGWPEMSNFMERWSDVLFLKFEDEKDELVREIIKSMMVGLPGRFLRQPEIYTLISLADAVPHVDIPLLMHWHEPGDRKFSDYAIHPEYDKESTALSYVGSYIVAEMRRELYHLMKEEHEHGIRVIRSYIDSYSIDASAMGSNASLYRNIGQNIGQWKEEEYHDVWAEENRFVAYRPSTDERVMKAPGYSQEQRLKLWRKYYSIMKEESHV